jgi:threonine synthase
MVGVTTAFGNEALRRFYSDSSGDFAETAFNEPLVSERSFDVDEALRAVHESKGYVFGFPDDVALRYAELLRATVGIKPLPASALVLAGLVKFARKFGLSNGRFVLVVTGGVRDG